MPNHLLRIRDLSLATQDALFQEARRLRDLGLSNLPQPLARKTVLTAFFEPSTRTRLSFESAVVRLGGSVLGFRESVSSMEKGETIADTARMVSGYADAVIIRHPKSQVVHDWAAASEIPLINAGDGSAEHPTQALLDALTILDHHPIDAKLRVGFVGDLKHSRTVHSLVPLLTARGVEKISWIAPDTLLPPDEVASLAPKAKHFATFKADMIDKFDVLYWTRIQEERFKNSEESLLHRGKWILNPDWLEDAPKKLCILSPLPRREELPPAVDAFPQARYFEQAKNGLWIRMAILTQWVGQLT